MSIAPLRAQRDELQARGVAIVDAAARAGRNDLSEREQREYDEILRGIRDVDDVIESMQSNEKRERETEQAFASLGLGSPGSANARGDGEIARELRQRIQDNDRRPFTISMRGLPSGVEARDISTTSGTGLPVRYANEIVRGMVATSGILAAGARMVTTASGEDYKVPKSTANSTAAIVAEGAAISESDPTLTAATLKAYKYGVLIDVTHEMVTDASFDVAGYLAVQAGEAIGTAFGAHLATGDGSGKPSGVVSAATVGVTGATTGASGLFTADELIDLQHSVASPYQRNAAWVMRSATLGSVRKLVDSNNRYLFEADVRPDDPQAVGTLLGRPVYLDESVPAVATSARSVLYGDFTRVWVRQTENLRFESTESFRFGNDIVSFRCLHRLDGALIDTTGAVKAYVGAAT